MQALLLQEALQVLEAKGDGNLRLQYWHGESVPAQPGKVEAISAIGKR